MALADDILIERAQKDFDDGLLHTRAQMKSKHGLIVGTTLDGLVMTAVTALGMRSRMKEDVLLLLGLAHRVAAGEDPRPLAEANLHHVLRLKSKMNLIAREDDPDFQPIKTMALALFIKRLPDLARLATVRDPTDYGDLVRKAFPERGPVDIMVEENAQTMLAIIEHLETHPHVLRMPSGFAPKVAIMARDMIVWKVSEVKRGVDAIYSA